MPTPPEDAAGGDEAGGAGLTAGRRLGPYRIIRKLGEGGMGVVHLAEDTRLGRRVAIKALPPRFTRDERRRRRLRREARAAASLTHPGIATVHALEEFDGALCIVSEYVAGETLRQELAAGPLPPADLLDTAIAIARALAAAHEGNVLHRDLKPENVIRVRDTGIEDAGVKIVDFGLARFGDPEAAAASATQLTAPGAMLGTPGYMAPEQIRGEPVDFRADIFAFGVLLFELATGSHPFTSATPVSTVARVLEATPPDLRQLAPACPAALAAVIRRCLQKDPAQRYAATRELVDDLAGARRTPAESPAALRNGGAASGSHDPQRGQRPGPADGAASGSHEPQHGQRPGPADGAASGSHEPQPDNDRARPTERRAAATNRNTDNDGPGRRSGERPRPGARTTVGCDPRGRAGQRRSGTRNAVEPGVVVAVPPARGGRRLLRDAVPPVARARVGPAAVGVRAVLRRPRGGAGGRQPPVPPLLHGAVHPRRARPPADPRRAVGPRRGLAVRGPAAGRDRPDRRHPSGLGQPHGRRGHRQRRHLPRHRARHHPRRLPRPHLSSVFPG